MCTHTQNFLWRNHILSQFINTFNVKNIIKGSLQYVYKYVYLLNNKFRDIKSAMWLFDLNRKNERTDESCKCFILDNKDRSWTFSLRNKTVKLYVYSTECPRTNYLRIPKNSKCIFKINNIYRNKYNV